MTKLSCAIVCALLSCVLVVGTAAADTPIETMRGFYLAAEYERALAVIDTIDAVNLTPQLKAEIAGYQAASLAALGRVSDAERVMETIVRLRPDVTEPVDSSPKLRAMFGGVRARVLPLVLRARYAEGKSLFEAGKYPEAHAAFTEVVSLQLTGVTGTDAALEDIRTLATDFAEVTRGRIERERAAAAILPSAQARIYNASDTNVVPPEIISQAVNRSPIEAWLIGLRKTSPDPVIVDLSVTISESGEVERVALLRPVAPNIDRALLASAKKWRYAPARLNGTPVKFAKAVRVELK
jgi:hypothetical protein